MTNSAVMDLMYEFFVISIKLAAPILIVSLVIGIIISVLQAATQIHEQTLTFVPKLIVIAIVLLMLGGSMLESLQDFTKRIFELMMI